MHVLKCGAVIDDEDVDQVLEMGTGWYIPNGGGWKGYVILDKKIDGKRTIFTFHRFVMNAKSGELIDHKDGNPLNNQKTNLRRSDKRKNSQNMHHSKNQKN